MEDFRTLWGGGVPTHSFWDIDFWFFAKFIICDIFHHIKSQFGCDPLKGVIQGGPPLKTGFLRILSMFLRIETSSFLQRSSFWCNLKILNSHIGSDPLKEVNQGGCNSKKATPQKGYTPKRLLQKGYTQKRLHFKKATPQKGYTSKRLVLSKGY